MKSKEKKTYKIKISIKNILYFIAGIIILLYMFMFYNLYFTNNETYAKETDSEPENIKMSEANEIDIDSIINENSKPGYREEITREEQELEYLTTYNVNPDIPKGISYVVKEGRKGTQEITIKRTYQDDQLISEEQIDAVMTKATLNKVIEIGGGKTTSNKKVKVGDNVYVTSDMLSVMSEPNMESKKVATLKTDEKLEVLEISQNWYRVLSSSIEGWVEQECTTYLEPDYEEEINNNESAGQASNQNIQKLSFGMNLNKPSGLSLEQFKKVLTYDKNVNNVFQDNA